MAVSVSIAKDKLMRVRADAYALCVEQGALDAVKKVFGSVFPSILEYCKKHDFTGKAETITSVPVDHDGRLIYLLVLGLGAKKDKKLSVENYRRAIAMAIRFMQKNKLATLALQLPDTQLFGVDDDFLAQEMATIVSMTDYVFDTFKEVSGGRVPLKLSIILDDHDAKKIKKGLERGELIGAAVNDARQWINLPANIMRPDELASQARQLSKKYGFACRIFSEKEIQDMGLGGLAAVSSGSEQDCCLIVMEYKTNKENAQTIAFVGKGITYDSGGLSLKPAKSMETMKEDMSGAAAVIATMQLLAQLKPDINVIGIAPVAENLPSGSSAKPGDIVRMYNGMTVEIKNTDAEGRLLLADALAYVIKNYKPAAVIDVATLTGACMHALGPFFTGLFTEHEEVKKRIEQAGAISGESVWQLPLTDDYKKAMDSVVADLNNIADPKYMAGATTAAVFLQKFVGDTPWAHLDIAGTSFDVPNIPYYSRETATGVGVRLLTQVAMEWGKHP